MICDVFGCWESATHAVEHGLYVGVYCYAHVPRIHPRRTQQAPTDEQREQEKSR